MDRAEVVRGRRGQAVVGAAALRVPEVLLDRPSIGAALAGQNAVLAVVGLLGLLGCGVLVCLLSRGGRPIVRRLGFVGGGLLVTGAMLAPVLLWGNGFVLIARLVFGCVTLAALVLAAWTVAMSRELGRGRAAGMLGAAGLVLLVVRSLVWLVNLTRPVVDGYWVAAAVVTVLAVLFFPLWMLCCYAWDSAVAAGSATAGGRRCRGRGDRVGLHRRHGCHYADPRVRGRAGGAVARRVDALVRVRAQTRTPICAGENLYLRWGFRELLERGAVDVIEPDVPKCGGLAEAKKIANLAGLHYIPFAPHLVSTPLGTMATSHQCGAIPNFYVQEWHALEERAVWDSYVHAPDGSGSIVKDGYITLPDTPGIGVELDLDGVRAHAVAGYGVFE